VAKVDIPESFLTVFDCASYIREKTYEPFLKIRKLYDSIRTTKSKEFLNSKKSLKEIGKASVEEFNKQNGKNVTLCDNCVTTCDPDIIKYNCNVSTPKASGGVNIPSIIVCLDENIEKTPSEMLSSLRKLKEMGIVDFQVRPTNVSPNCLIPLRSLYSDRLTGILDSSRGLVKLVDKRMVPSLLESTITYYPREQRVEVRYNDNGTLIGATQETISEERKWLEETVRAFFE
jgi:hypothetical protein